MSQQDPSVLDSTRRSWNLATRNHNAHKGDQAAQLRAGRHTLFPEELELLGPLGGRRLLHMQCNAGQDSLSLAHLGAQVTGVDMSDEAIAFARRLSTEAAIPATFIESELLAFLHSTAERYDLAFSSYGAVGWIADLSGWARGVARVLTPGGRFVYVEFHPLVWSIGADLRLSGDDYFSKEPFCEPVGDYVSDSGIGLLVDPTASQASAQTIENRVPATSWQHTLGDLVTALCDAGLRLRCLREYPYANGCRVNRALVMDEARRWCWPPGAARLPLMFGLCAERPE